VVKTVTGRKRKGEREALSSYHLKGFDPQGKRVDFYDDEGAMMYRASKQGGGQFIFRYKRDGKYRSITIGKNPGMSLRQARAKAETLQEQIDAGVDPASEQREVRAALKERSFEKLARMYLNRHVEHLRTGDEQRRVFKVRIIPHFGPRTLDDITKPEVAEFLHGIAAEGKPVMANRTLAFLRGMFNWLVDNGLAENNPAAKVSRPGGKEVPRDRVLGDDELRRVWLACENAFGCIVKIALLTAQRRAPIASMQWKDLNLDAGVWSIPPTDMKMGRPHRVLLSPQAVAVLRQLQQGAIGPYVFGKNGHHPYSGFSRSRAQLQSASGTEGWTLHDLRRTATTRLAQLKVPVEVMRKILDHSAPSNDMLSRVYVQHEYAEEARAALDALGRHIDGVVTLTSYHQKFGKVQISGRCYSMT
jgi:integrase